MKTLPVKFSLDNVSQLYVGKTNGCTCGCAGYYIVTENHREERIKKDGVDLYANDKKILDAIDEISMHDDVKVGVLLDEIQFKTEKYILFIKIK
jgi:hypothetical protein